MPTPLIVFSTSISTFIPVPTAVPSAGSADDSAPCGHDGVRRHAIGKALRTHVGQAPRLLAGILPRS